jgi:hypothetical protein
MDAFYPHKTPFQIFRIAEEVRLDGSLTTGHLLGTDGENPNCNGRIVHSAFRATEGPNSAIEPAASRAGGFADACLQLAVGSHRLQKREIARWISLVSRPQAHRVD